MRTSPDDCRREGSRPRASKIFLFASIATIICSWQAIPIRAASKAVWITPEEAQLPAYQGIPHFKTRGIPLGPRIVVLSPPSSGDAFVSNRPVKLRVRFETTADAPVDIRTLKVTYLRLLGIDITDRVRPYVNENGIEVDNVEIPPGEHRIELEIKDRQGHDTDEILKLIVK
jgi:hypothetical protein